MPRECNVCGEPMFSEPGSVHQECKEEDDDLEFDDDMTDLWEDSEEGGDCDD